MKEIPLTQGFVAIVDDEDYDMLSKFKWCVDRKRHCSYAKFARKINGKYVTFYMHQIILNIQDKNLVPDHIDGDGLNNQRSNLRLATHAQNAHNSKKKPGMYLYKGVAHDKRGKTKQWFAHIRKDYKRIFLGYYATEEEAAVAYDKKATELFGEFAKLNFP